MRHEISITSAGTEVDLVMIRGLNSVTVCLCQLCKHACGTVCSVRLSTTQWGSAERVFVKNHTSILLKLQTVGQWPKDTGMLEGS